ncbi:MAG: hypothetical protein LBK61_09695 [Spirochaetaceae bacterium]|nr:hypothetical protein [Spirochaetaceae bacterium]
MKKEELNMVKLTRTIALLGFTLLSSCALSKALYLGDDIYSRKAGLHYRDAPRSSEDINGVFPEAVYIKTRTQTFNTYHYYVLHDGAIWYKSIDTGAEPANWTPFDEAGLAPRIGEIAADADELVALSDEGGFYRFCFDKTIAHRSGVWLDKQGWPNEEPLFLDRRTAQNRSWAVGKRNAHVLYYEDPFGNQHHNGTMEIVTTYVLLEDGQEICYSDTGLPADFSRNYSGPERGAFKAVSLSASASTMFVINEAGEMYTRLADFDTVGCDPMFFKYTYVPYQSDVPGTDYFSNLNEWGLPAEDWRRQPPIPVTPVIPVTGNAAGSHAALTRHITILQNGQGNGARELRVAGLNEAGETGYWTKAIFDDAWEFQTAPLSFNEDAFLKPADSPSPAASPYAERGPSPDKQYRGYCWHGGEKETGWEYTIPNFNILEGDCDFRITWRGETCTLKLYPVEMWSYLKRDYLPGRTGSPKMFMVTLAIPDNAFDGLSAAFIEQLAQRYMQNDKKLFQYTIAASHQYLLQRDTGDTEPVLFLTDGTVSNQYTEFRQTWLVKDFEEAARYSAPELTIDRQSVLSHEALIDKIALNKTLRDELQYRVRALKWSQLTAFKFNFSYIPAHYIARLTPLRFVDMPKIRTVTTFGERVVMANSAYVSATANVRIWLYERIIALLEARLRYYNDLAKELSETAAAETRDIALPALPSQYSENISGYWDSAGLPRVIAGTFFSPQSGPKRTERPAVISFVLPGTEPELLGWYLSIGSLEDIEDKLSSARADTSFSLFIDPLQSPRTIYSRNGKPPEEKRLQLDCVMYVHPGIHPPVEQEIIDRMLKPFINTNDQGIKARIIFDGHTFEIRQHPAARSNSLIFRGEL